MIGPRTNIKSPVASVSFSRLLWNKGRRLLIILPSKQSSVPTMNQSSPAAAAQPQQAPPTALYDEFRAGLTACLRSWSALRAAVEGGWGGHDSLGKAEDLRNNILQHFDGSSATPRALTIDDLEDNLAIYLEEEFSVALEDNSERQVADVIWRMYEQCMQGNATLAQQVVQAAVGVMQQSASYPVQVQSTGEDDDDDDDDDDDMAMETADDDNAMTSDAAAPTLVAMPTPATINAAAYAAESLFGPPKPQRPVVDEKPVRQLGEAVMAEPVAEVDEDGFAPVVKRKGRKM